MVLEHGADPQLFLIKLRYLGRPRKGIQEAIMISKSQHETYHRIGILRQPSHGEEAVVWIDYDITTALSVREYGICLYELLRKAVIHPFEDVAAEARACATSNGV